jgi:hypothetical protein
MLPAAHIVTALLVNRFVWNDDRLLPAALVALLPDAIDKTSAWVFRLSQSSHRVAHNLMAVAGFSLLAATLWGPEAARSFGSAYVIHLVGDELHNGRVPWFAPFSAQTRQPPLQGRRRAATWAVGVALELPAIALLIRLASQRYQGRRGVG